MISPINSHCFGSIFPVQIKQLYQFTSLFPCKCHLVGTFEHLIEETIFPHCLLKVFHKQCFAHGVLWLVLLLSIPVNYAKCVNAPPLCVVIGPLQCSSLQMFYAANFRHTCIVPTPFMVFQCADQFAQEKSGCCHSKISKLFHCNRNRESSIVLNHHNLERIPSNNNIWNFLSIGWADRPLGVHISGKFFLDHPVYTVTIPPPTNSANRWNEPTKRVATLETERVEWKKTKVVAGEKLAQGEGPIQVNRRWLPPFCVVWRVAERPNDSFLVSPFNCDSVGIYISCWFLWNCIRSCICVCDVLWLRIKDKRPNWCFAESTWTPMDTHRPHHVTDY